MSELSIKIDYLEKRKNPSEVFEAMALYIKAYKGLGQLLTDSVGIKADFDFQLIDIEKGSVLSKLSAWPSSIGEKLEGAFYSSGNKLLNTLTFETGTEDEVEKLSAELETDLASRIDRKIADPFIDRSAFAYVLKSFSDANQKMMEGERIIFISKDENCSPCELKASWRFNGNPTEMFRGCVKSHSIKGFFFVVSPVNEGNSVWCLKDTRTEKRFSARITHKDWLERYQNGLIPAIGPKDVMEAVVSQDIYTPPKGKGSPKIRNIRVTSIVEIKRNGGYQHEITA